LIKLEKTYVFGWEAAIRGMRNPMNSWDQSDSGYCVQMPCSECAMNENKEVDLDGVAVSCICPDNIDYVIGDNDLKLMKSLSKAGNDHAKFLRMINVTFDVTCHHAWWAEFDTYKVSTVRNSCSKMHKIHVKEFVKDDFSTEGIDSLNIDYVTDTFERVVDTLEYLRNKFNETHDKRYWRAIIEILPMGYNIKATIQLNYQVLKSMYFARKNHKLDEWREFCKWCETLPYFKELIFQE
jgi:hypothetical protein